MTGFDVMGAALIFMMLCWQVPKLFAAVLGGSPALSGGDLVSTGTAVVGGAATIAAVGVSAVAAAAGATAGASGATGTVGATATRSIAGIGGASSTGNVPPPSLSPGPSTNGRPRQPNPPASGARAAVPILNLNAGSSESVRSVLSSVGGERLSGSGFEAERPAASFHSYSVPITPRAASQSSTSNGEGAGVDDIATGLGSHGSGPQSSDSPVSNVAGSAASPSLHEPAPGRKEILASGVRLTGRVFSGIAQGLLGTRPHFRGVPSDAAPHTQPPRMPIDHSE
jgi:hypothetical protein